MKLYYAPYTSALAAYVVIQELALDVELVLIKNTGRVASSSSIVKSTHLQPLAHSVPVLRLDRGDCITEITGIFYYLSECCPEGRLMPRVGSYLYYQLQDWLKFIGTDLRKSLALKMGRVLESGTADPQGETLTRTLSYLTAFLKQNDFLVGERFSVADAYLFSVLFNARQCGLDLSKWPVLEAFFVRVGARPAVQRAVLVEAAASDPIEKEVYAKDDECPR